MSDILRQFGSRAVAAMSIHDIFQPLENLIMWSDGFTDEEIRDVISLGEMAEFQKGVIGSDTSPSTDLNIRDTEISWINPSEQSEWLYKRLQQIVSRVNHDKFQFDLDTLDVLQYAKYKEGQFYNWHTDSGPTLSFHRKLSVVVGLAEPNEYEGGELVFNLNGNPDTCEIVKLKPGTTAIFPSWVVHKVNPVTSGERTSLVTWVRGPKFK
jgi:PKHD-type hydroxylase